MKPNPRSAISNPHFIEPLGARIAPAILVNPTTVTYVDGDGDAVTVKISKGAFDGVPLALTAGPRNDLAPVSVGTATGDVFVLEVV